MLHGRSAETARIDELLAAARSASAITGGDRAGHLAVVYPSTAGTHAG